MLSPICMANSLVGVTIKERILPCFFRSGDAYNNCKIGIEKAAVFPVPVCAQPIKSLPFKTMGIAFSWMGVGLV